MRYGELDIFDDSFDQLEHDGSVEWETIFAKDLKDSIFLEEEIPFGDNNNE
jgi:hypothetical protein